MTQRRGTPQRCSCGSVDTTWTDHAYAEFKTLVVHGQHHCYSQPRYTCLKGTNLG